jgi:transcriptional regulator with XRE-family HTH domain
MKENRLIEALKTARQAKGLKQAELGAKLGLPQSHLSNIERGEIDPRLSTVTEMARLLDLEPMLIPRELVPAVRALLRGKSDDAPAWVAEEDDDA